MNQLAFHRVGSTAAVMRLGVLMPIPKGMSCWALNMDHTAFGPMQQRRRSPSGGFSHGSYAWEVI